MKACIESDNPSSCPLSLQSNRNHKIYYGEWTQDDLCYTELFDEWKSERGIEVIPVLSRASKPKSYVQSRLQEDEALVCQPPESIGATLCGMDAMVDDCTSVLTNAGIPKNNILLNL